MSEPKPLADLIVGDRFWLGYAQELVRAAVSAPERRAEQLAAAVAWLWTIYSSAVLVVLGVGGARPPMPAALALALPSALLIVAYWSAARVRRPIPVEFDPRVPVQIEQVHAAAARDKAGQLEAAERWAGVATASVVLALLVALIAPGTPHVELAVRADPADPQQLLVLAAVPADAVVQLSVRPADAGASAAASRLERADAHGRLQARLPVAGPGPQRVTATWREGTLERSVSTLHPPRD